MNQKKSCIIRKRAYHKKIRWTAEEDKKLTELVQNYGTSWYNVASLMNQRTQNQCSQRWKVIGYQSHQYKQWTKDEDEIIMRAMQVHNKNWSKIQNLLPNRNAHQIRERYINYLDLELDKSPWNQNEDQIIQNWVKEHGTKWSALSKVLKNRSQNSIKNRYYSQIRKQYVNQQNSDQKIISFVKNDQSQTLSQEFYTELLEFEDLNKKNDFFIQNSNDNLIFTYNNENY